ncbi:MAG: BMP family ABC transporter substrate-binding protein [Oligoflexales bacterium]|nr:BMP family ABC transporter substrate-binding protein [Oligoflexales bacterium]
MYNKKEYEISNQFTRWRQNTMKVTLFLSALVLLLIGCGSSGSSSSDETKLKVGLIPDTGRVDDNTFAQSAYNGGTKAAKSFNVQFDYAQFTYNQNTSADDYKNFIQKFIDSGYQMIITVGYLMADITNTMAKANPNIKFASLDNSYTEYPSNMAGLVFREDQPAYLAGIVAGKMSVTKKLGVIGGVSIPQVRGFVNGFKSGVSSVCESCKVSCVYIMSFGSPDKGKEQAKIMIDGGADVIFGAGGATGSGGVLYATQSGKWGIGVDLDEYYTTYKSGAEPSVTNLITSAMKGIDTSVYDIVKTLVNGTFTSGTHVYDASNDGIGLAPYHNMDSLVTADIKTAVSAAYTKLKTDATVTNVDRATGALNTSADKANAALDGCTTVTVQ